MFCFQNLVILTLARSAYIYDALIATRPSTFLGIVDFNSLLRLKKKTEHFSLNWFYSKLSHIFIISYPVAHCYDNHPAVHFISTVNMCTFFFSFLLCKCSAWFL